MQQLLRYGAYAQLLTTMQMLPSVEEAAAALAQQWKFCANVGDWRFVSTIEREALRTDVARGTAKVERLPVADLLPWERHYAGASGHLPAPVKASDAAERGFPDALKVANLAERMILPVSFRGRALGVFFIGAEQASFDALDRKFIELVAYLFAGKVTHLLSHEAETRTLRRQATIDALTRIANRRQFDARFEIEWVNAARVAQPLALILVDIDFFKQYNDRYGHAQGDVCLREVAQMLQSAVRPADLVARVGGEEFAILLPGLSATSAALVAQRARLAVAMACIPHAASEVAEHVSVSMGVACAVPDGATVPAALYADADQGLYGAKRAGRNRVQIHAPASDESEDRSD